MKLAKPSASQANKPMDIDGIFRDIGDIGPVQWKYVFILCLLRMNIALHGLHYNFASRKIQFFCLEGTLNRAGAPCQNPQFDLSEGSSIVTTFSLVEDRLVFPFRCHRSTNVGGICRPQN